MAKSSRTGVLLSKVRDDAIEEFRDNIKRHFYDTLNKIGEKHIEESKTHEQYDKLLDQTLDDLTFYNHLNDPHRDNVYDSFLSSLADKSIPLQLTNLSATFNNKRKLLDFQRDFKLEVDRFRQARICQPTVDKIKQQMSYQHERDLANLEKELESSKNEITEVFKQQIAALHTTHQQALATTHDTHKQELATIHDKHLQQLASTQNTHKEEFDKAQTTHATLLATTHTTHKDEVNKLNENFNQKLTVLANEHKNELEKVKELHKQEITKINDTCEKMKKDMDVQHANQLSKIKHELDEVQQQLRGAVKKLDENIQHRLQEVMKKLDEFHVGVKDTHRPAQSHGETSEQKKKLNIS
ncbi:unnamed protein product [Didymodactylos carnosus]|uniref:Uncharacterized protein n=1 Tax=Didymodactylos carnosus TaxID=1234261 RepID=A0A816CV42_9BILA|nr:unnamed protein product [Didymodactylos carnosus]CAF1626527.1 unnamed protein product [Didymodactylos carnosus]CAF3620395.1 unnamed protein product [Didymodactylos carnosus]CAF4520774.1 unnamed protein product [Didymodactylos carnosus]